MDVRIETIKARPQYGYYPTGAPTRYTVTVQVVVVGADDPGDAARMVAAAINNASVGPTKPPSPGLKVGQM